MRKFYCDFNLKPQQIDEITGALWKKKETIKDALKRYKIKRKNPITPRPRYGEKIVAGIRIPHKGEQKVIGIMLKLKDDGQSLHLHCQLSK